MPLITSDLEFSDDYPTIEPSLRLDFANTRALDSRISFTRASTATYVGANGLIKTAGVDEPRFDHDPATGESLGLLIEESRDNLIAESILDPNSGLTSPTFWLVQEFSSPTQVTDPFGSNNAYQYLSVGGTVRSRIISASATNPTQADSVVGQQYAFSIFAKTVNYDTITFGSSAPPWTNGTGNTRVLFNLTTGTVVSDISTMGSVSSASMIPYGDGWWRLVVTTIPATAAVGLKLYIDLGVNGDDTHTTSEGLQLFGAQIEVGTFPTSYIPTSGSTVTRAQDTPLITGTNFTDFYNQSEGTLVLSADIGDLTASNQTAVAFEDTSNVSASFIAMGYNTGGGGSGHVGAWYNSSGITSAFKTHNIGVTINTEFKQSFAYKLDDFSSVVNGGAPLTDNSGGITTLIDRVRFGNYHYGGMSSGHIKQFTYYPKRLTNAQLQTLTQ